MKAANTYQITLTDGQTLALERVNDKATDLTQDQNMGVSAFVSAYANASDEEIQEHFTAPEKIRDYYNNLIEDYDIQPFRAGKMVWIRAFLQEKFVGWMGLEANFINKNTTYISTFVLDPMYEGKGIGEKMIASIADHWLPETTELNLIVRNINHKALGFYRRMGFVPATEIEHHYVDNPRHCMFMRLRLS
ncbi:MAG: GNAT family N-acetyltransferase [Pseudomonadota bacterium]|nr:GNAT family N-acetyltransferase [Pseudomonadota bacterium]